MVTGYTVDKIGKGGQKKGLDDADGLETTKEKGKKPKKDGDKKKQKEKKPEDKKTEGKKPEDKKPKDKNESQGGTPPEKEPSNTSGRSTVTTIDYSYKFDRELANFNDGYEIRTTVDKDLILVQYSSDAPDASLCYWTTVDEANGITTLND